MSSTEEDPRREELETLEAIYPEIRHPDGSDPFTFELELPVEPASSLLVTFPPPSSGIAAPGQGALPPQLAPNARRQPDSLEITYLPSLTLRISLPPGYPKDEPPRVEITTEPPWLSQDTIARLQDDGPRMWDEAGHDMIAYAYIDHIQRGTEDVFGSIDSDGTMQLDAQHKLALLDYNLKARTAAFGRRTFDCGICLDPKKGTACHEMLDCGHVFCLQCLRDFYNDAISQGSVETVRCLTPGCAKARAEAQAQGKAKKARRIFVNPSELLQIGLSEDTVKRYVSLKYKMELEADKNTIYCPRSWCNGAARSKAHKKPLGLDFAESSDAESDGEDDGKGNDTDDTVTKSTAKPSSEDLIAICEDCSYAFCSRCYQSWHGTFFRCWPKNVNPDEISAEEKASLAYIKRYTSPCPTCGVLSQKSHGCNHMLCSRCNTHFCYLCSAWLEPGNPYKHFNNEREPGCYMRLWDMEEGDGERGFIRPEPEPIRGPDADWEDRDLEDVEEQPQDNIHRENNAARRLEERGHPVAVAREAPLVLRLVNDQDDGARPPMPNAPHGANRPANAPHPGQQRLGAGNAPRGGRGGRVQAGRAGRLRGGRRGGAGGAGLGDPANHNNRQNQGRRNQENQADQAQVQAQAQELDAAQQAWVRRFVEMALMDAEDEIEGDSDEEGEMWRIAPAWN